MTPEKEGKEFEHDMNCDCGIFLWFTVPDEKLSCVLCFYTLHCILFVLMFLWIVFRLNEFGFICTKCTSWHDNPNMTIIWRMTTVKTWKLTSHTTIITFINLMMLHLWNPIISILVLCILTSCQIPHFIYYVLNAWVKKNEQFVGSVALWIVYNSTQKHPIFVNILNSLLISQFNLVKG